jgi:hypothetical protein
MPYSLANPVKGSRIPILITAGPTGEELVDKLNEEEELEGDVTERRPSVSPATAAITITTQITTTIIALLIARLERIEKYN